MIFGYSVSYPQGLLQVVTRQEILAFVFNVCGLRFELTMIALDTFLHFWGVLWLGFK